ncbi:MAG TPA: nucleotidyltransferase domain-containing protein [Labilithrix sp.]
MTLSRLSPPVAAALEAFASQVRSRFGERVRELALFGSHARGDAHPESDVDILVVIDDVSFDEIREVIRIAYDIDAADDAGWVGLAPVTLSTAAAADMRARERLLLKDVARDGVAL